ncbi:helix-turn-helix domain-containing protein [Methylotenera sp. G11]|uniref:AraC-like ligand-binding domain-containing protein n=1 Tax=Methylotenera sp. G11 TaxID=1506585 RepID=UPI000648B20A|nr:helix-turn-helix domain-containing protein [Methylotenera sp. G11]
MGQQDLNSEQLNRPLRLSTEDIPAWCRQEWLREVIGREYANVDITPPRSERLFNEMAIYSGKLMRLSVIHSNSITITRLPKEPSLISQDAYFGVILLAGEYLLEQNNREVFLKPGDMTIYDATRPHRIHCPESFSKLIISIPRKLMRERLAGVEHCTALHIKSEQGAGSIASHFIQSMAREADRISRNTFDALSENSLDLFTLALNGIRPQSHNLSRSRSLSLFRVKEFIERNITNPLLDTAAIESGTGLSARYINELLQYEGTSLMRYVWNSRLTHCHKELSSPDCFPNRISDVALQWGFNDFSHFSRAYKKKYGMSPRDARNH